LDFAEHGTRPEAGGLDGDAGAAIDASDVAMNLAYHGDRGQELVPPVVAGGATVIASGAKGMISKTFRVEDPKELFQTRYLRVRVELPGYPAVTFSGSNPESWGS
jgi:hypothetical protein